MTHVSDIQSLPILIMTLTNHNVIKTITTSFDKLNCIIIPVFMLQSKLMAWIYFTSLKSEVFYDECYCTIAVWMDKIDSCFSWIVFDNLIPALKIRSVEIAWAVIMVILLYRAWIKNVLRTTPFHPRSTILVRLFSTCIAHNYI